MDLKKMKYHLGKNLTISQLRNRKKLKKIITKLQGEILDLGCGNGEYSFLMAKKKGNLITALDASPELIGEIEKTLEIKKINNISVVKGNAQNLSFKENFINKFKKGIS